MTPEQFNAKLHELRGMERHAKDRMRAYPSGSLMRNYWEGVATGYGDAIKTLSKDLPPFELRHLGIERAEP